MKQTNKQNRFSLLKINVWFETQTEKKVITNWERKKFGVFFICFCCWLMLFCLNLYHAIQTHTMQCGLVFNAKIDSHKKYIRKKYKQHGWRRWRFLSL